MVLPALQKIAVCGHRQLAEPAALLPVIQVAEDKIQFAYPGQRFEILSCLAEGADRLLVQVLLKSLQAELTLVLPMPETEYLKDFLGQESIDKYHHLRGMARKIILTDCSTTRPDVYLSASRYLVEFCHILIAIWDGKQARGPGGTGEVVMLARKSDLPLIWIHTGTLEKPVSLTFERFNRTA